MTSWKRARDKQHKELRTPKFRQRVVPMERNERLKEIEEKEFLDELTLVKHNEPND